jgi:uncharacterized protein
MPMTIDYGNLMHRAMRSLIREVLDGVAKDGLPGEHHFFITFDTTHPDTEMADWLSDRYPTEMTVVMQHWFDKLDVGEDGFAVTLNFGDNPEPLFIPYDAIKTFVDPSVEFGLRFETQPDDEDDDEDVDTLENAAVPLPLPEPKKVSKIKSEVKQDLAKRDADVVSLDKFRK